MFDSEGPPGATPDQPQGRREHIIDGAAEMFAEHGYYGSSLRDISRHVGISRSGMLHHVESKDVLLGAVIDRLEDHAEMAMERVRDVEGSREAFLQILAEVWNPSSLPVRLLATLDAETVSEDHPGRYRLARLRKVHEHLLETCFSRLDQEKLPDGQSDAAFAGRALFAMVLNLAVREKTVRPYQHADADDAPLADLARLVDAVLAPESLEPPADET